MVLVLTRNKGYRKEEKEVKLPPFFYHKYPALKISVLKAIEAQKGRIETGEFISTLHNNNFDFFAGLPKTAAVGVPD